MGSPVPQLVLASASPRRRDLLAGVGLHFQVRPADVDETLAGGECPWVAVARLARAKAVKEAHPGELVIAADTLVTIDGEVLGKPADDADAARMLARLAGREHEVATAVAVLDVDQGRLVAGVERTRVAFAPLTPPEIDWYVATGEPRDKAGAYGIQGQGALFVERVSGNYGTVVGLPLPLLYRLLRELGHDPLASFGTLPAAAVDRSQSGRYVGRRAHDGEER